MKNKLPIVVGMEIPLDEFGRYNLNVLHKASGGDKKNGPAYWLALDSTKDLIGELDKQTTEITVVKSAGRYGGTFAHELLAVEYAGWISSAFRLQVNQAFIDYRSGKTQIDLSNMPSLEHLEGRFEELRNIVARDEQQEAELPTTCSLIMNARKKTKPARRKMMDALEAAGQGTIELTGGGKK